MRHPLRAVAGVVAGAGLLLVAGGITGSAQARTVATAWPKSAGGTLVKAHSAQALPRRGGTIDSLNWSGYVVTPTGGGVTGVTSTFVVPTASLIPPGFAATWAGIGGYSSSDLIQAGISENSLPSNPLLGPQYSAWYEMLPAAETPLTDCEGVSSCPVVPGDQITVSIAETATANQWTISLADATRGWWWTKTVSYTSSRSSAEWILEAPTLLVAQTLLANVGTVKFGPVSTFTDTSSSGPLTIADGDPTQIDLSPGLVNFATPSALAPDGQSFNDCSYAQTCATP